MTRKRRSTTATLTTATIENETPFPIISLPAEKDSTYKSLRERLEEINKQEDVTGYILRNMTTATIDLKDPSSLLALALLASYAVDTGHEYSETFDLGKVESILLEGKNTKVLCIAIGKNIVNVFMEKKADHAQILNQICTDREQ